MLRSFIFITLFALLNIFPLSAGTIAFEKQYCTKDELELEEGRILMQREGCTFELDSLFVDEGGIYFIDDTSLRCLSCHRPINPKNTCESPQCLNPR